ncbi:MAG: multidrug efflux pump subunit AcrA (membrane-fusion protein), partial [Candidatus Paceibacteria bacterium]
MKNKRNIGFIIGGVALLIFIVMRIIGGGSEPDVEEVTSRKQVGVIFPHGAAGVIDSLNFTGSIKAARSAEVSSEISGIIERTHVSEGSFVSAGDRIITLKNDSQEISLQQAQSDLVTAESLLVDLQRQYTE